MAFAARLLGGVPMGELEEEEEDEEDEVQGPMPPANSSSPPPASGSSSDDGSSSGSEGESSGDARDSGKMPRAKARDPEWVKVCVSTTRDAHKEAMFNELQSGGSLRNGTPRAISGPVKSVKSVGKVCNWRCAFWNSAECPAVWRVEERDEETFVLLRASAPEMQHNAHEPKQKVRARARRLCARRRTT